MVRILGGAFMLVALLPAQQRTSSESHASSVAIGTTVAASFTDLHWNTRRIQPIPGVTATVIYFATVNCPMVVRSLPRLEAMARDYEQRGVLTIVMNVGPADAFMEAAGQVAEFAPAAVFGKDDALAVAAACGTERTNTVVVLDAAATLRYRGRIDDQQVYAGSRAQATRHDLRLAIDEVLAGTPVSVAETEVHGCRLTPRKPLDPARVPTYVADVAPILLGSCLPCHGNDSEAVVKLTTPEQVRKHAAMIAEVVGNGRMPPWFAAPTAQSFRNRRDLPLAARDVIRAWCEGGAPIGEGLPPVRHAMHLDWRIGEVHQEIVASDTIAIPAVGAIDYQYAVLPYRFEQETWVEAIDVRSEQPAALQHCNLAIVGDGESYSPWKWRANYTRHGPAVSCVVGSAIRIPAGSRLALQAYYVPTGTAVADRLRVGLRFPSAPIKREVRFSLFGAEEISIPPGARSHPAAGAMELPHGAIGVGLFVHMHARGRDARVVAVAPTGRVERLLVLASYPFAEQEIYMWPLEAVGFARGTRIEAVAHFDNSSWNPLNPDPAKRVRSGSSIDDECLSVSLLWCRSDEDLRLTVDQSNGRAVAQPGGSKGEPLGK